MTWLSNYRRYSLMIFLKNNEKKLLAQLSQFLQLIARPRLRPVGVLVNPELEFKLLVPAEPEPEIGFNGISGQNLLELIFIEINFIHEQTF